MLLAPPMLADNSDALVAYEPPLSESEGEYSATELAKRSKKVSVKKRKHPPVDRGQRKRFQIRSKKFSLTFPQCEESKEAVRTRMEERWPDCNYVIGQEKHEDGNHHLHIYLQFSSAISVSDPNYFDFIAGQHGSYEATKSVRAWVQYVTKEDTEYTAKGIDVKALINKRKNISKEVADMLDAGAKIEDVRKSNNHYFLINKKKIEDYGAYMSVILDREKKEPWVEPDWIKLTGSNRKIGQWLADNIRRLRPFKAPQLFIHGPRNLGKTSLIEYLKKSLSVYHIPTTEDFYDAFDNDYDLCVIDEFKGQKTIQWLNQFLDGQTVTLRKKGSQYLKTKNIPTIILSNFTLVDCYPGLKKAAAEALEKGYEVDNKLETLECRLKMVEVEEFIKVF